MKLYHASVVEDAGWFVGRTLEEPRITTQGRDLDELVYMIRDAIYEMTGDKDVHLEIILPPKVARRGAGKRGRGGSATKQQAA